MIAIKFGGSALADAEKIKNIAGLIEKLLDNKPIIVVSAIGNTTNELIRAGENAIQGKIDIESIKNLHYEIAKNLEINIENFSNLFAEIQNLLMGISLIRELSRRTLDYLISFGERLSVRILSSYLKQLGLNSKYFDSWDLGIVTNSNFGNAEILDDTYINLLNNLSGLESNYDYFPIITGFIGKDRDGNITTLGRGGSDLTVSVIGAALNVKEIQIWKDVDGILTCDPRVVQKPLPIPRISFEEASELAYFGAKVLHPRSILPAMRKNIPVIVKSYINPEYPGTEIINVYMDEKELLRAITYKKNVTLVDIVSTRMLGHYGFLANVFEILNDLKISVDMVATSEVSISFTLDDDQDLEKLHEELRKISTVNIKRGNTIISLIGNVHHSSEILNQAFSILYELRINVQMISQGASKVNISFIVNDENAEICIKKLHEQFFQGEKS
jgi:aspartate kinase